MIKDDRRKRTVTVTTYTDEGIVIGILQTATGRGRFYSFKPSIIIRPITRASEDRLLRLLARYIPTEHSYSAILQGSMTTYRFYQWFDLPASQPYSKLR